MKVKFLLSFSFFLILLLGGCGKSSSSSETKSYTISYDKTNTKISGVVQFNINDISAGHTVVLSDFVPSIEGCSVDYTSTSFSPQSLLFSKTSSTQLLNLDISLLEPCDKDTLVLNTKYSETSSLDGKVLNYSKDKSYTFSILKSKTFTKSYSIVADTSSITIRQNSQNENINIKVYDNDNVLVENGDVNVIYPDEAKKFDIGKMLPSTQTLNGGKASFIYTAPSDIKQLIDNNISSVKFKFYYESIATSTTVEIDFRPDKNQSVIKNYTLNLITDDGSYKTSLESTKSFSVKLENEDGIVADKDIERFDVSIDNASIAKLLSSNGSEGTHFVYTQNSVTLSLKSAKRSGLVPITVDVRFKDANGQTQTLQKTFDIIVESGPPTAISISYIDTAQNKEIGKFIERFAISVTDKYFNPVNTNPQLLVGAIVGYAYRDDNKTFSHRIYIDKPGATLSSTSLDFNSSILTIDTNTTDIDPSNDLLVTFGQGYTYYASGVWEIQSVYKQSIGLVPNQYNEEPISGLGFTIGRNYRQDTCNFGDEWVGQVGFENGNNKLNSDGTAVVTLTYDPYLVGKDIVLYINIIGHDNALDKDLKVGEAKKHTLRGHGVVVDTSSCVAEDGAQVVCRYYADLKDAPFVYRNANFGFDKISVSGKGSIVSITRPSIDDCNESGASYVEFTIKADDNETFSISPSNPLITKEF